VSNFFVNQKPDLLPERGQELKRQLRPAKCLITLSPSRITHHQFRISSQNGRFLESGRRAGAGSQLSDDLELIFESVSAETYRKKNIFAKCESYWL
jgi:hypothetical protein